MHYIVRTRLTLTYTYIEPHTSENMTQIFHMLPVRCHSSAARHVVICHMSLVTFYVSQTTLVTCHCELLQVFYHICCFVAWQLRLLFAKYHLAFSDVFSVTRCSSRGIVTSFWLGTLNILVLVFKPSTRSELLVRLVDSNKQADSLSNTIFHNVYVQNCLLVC